MENLDMPGFPHTDMILLVDTEADSEEREPRRA